MYFNGNKKVLPIFVFLVYLFLYLPVFFIMVFSFNDSSIGFQWEGFTLKWYSLLFSTKQLWIALYNSVIVAFSAVFLSVILSTFFIWALSVRFYYLMSVFYATMLIPDVIIASGLLSFYSFFKIPLGFPSLIVGHTLLGLGLAVPLIYTRYQELNYEIIEASMNLGASEFQTFYKVILPFLFPAISSAATSVLILSFDDFLISFFCAGSMSQTLSLYIFSIIRTGVSPIINALSTLILVFTSLFILFVNIYKIKVRRPKI